MMNDININGLAHLKIRMQGTDFRELMSDYFDVYRDATTAFYVRDKEDNIVIYDHLGKHTFKIPEQRYEIKAFLGRYRLLLSQMFSQNKDNSSPYSADFLWHASENKMHEIVESEIETAESYSPDKFLRELQEIKGKIDRKPALLILAGGKSSRMGENKAFLKYRDIPQVEYLLKMGKQHGLDAFISCKKAQHSLYEKYDAELIFDTVQEAGPMGAIISAMRKHRRSFIAMACDLPFVNVETLKSLLNSRDINKHATAFRNPQTDLSDPLCTIYEYTSLPYFLHFLQLDYRCPRKVLLNIAHEQIETPTENTLVNANSPEEKKWVEEELE